MLRPVNGVYINSFLHHLPQWTKSDRSEEKIEVGHRYKPHFTEFMHCLYDVFHNKINFRFCGETTDTKPERGVRHVLCSACIRLNMS